MLWLDAADNASIVRSPAGAVSYWGDRSGTHNTVAQPILAARPAFVPKGIGGLGNVSFDGVRSYLISNNNAFSTAVYPESTLFVVGRGTPDANTGATVWSGGNVGGYPRWGLGLPTAGVLTFFFGGANDRLYFPPSIDVSTPAVFDAGESVTLQTGFANYDGAAQTTLAGGITADPGSWPLSLGARYQPSPVQVTDFNRSQVAEVLAYGRLLAPAEIAKVEGYLACKWGLQSNLAPNHPFRTLCPGVVPLTLAPAALRFTAKSPQGVTISGGTPPYAATGCAGTAAFGLAGARLTVTPLATAAANCALAITDSSTPRESAALGVTIGNSAGVSVATYHVDNLRTGWNAAETTLTPAAVGSGTFGVQHSVALDDQVDSQPLVVASQAIATGPFAGVHDVVYVATAGDSIFALDATSGTVLASRNLGTPVTRSSVPGACGNSGPNVGITSTPVFDAATDTLYAMAYSATYTGPQYQLHALDASTLADRVPPVVVSASHVLADGTTYRFAAAVSRQRPGLLEANGNVYAAFGSFCDFDAGVSRGWLLGWHAGSLAPLSANQLDDRLTTAPHRFYLASIWMSGSGPAADASGNIYFATGNSDPSGTTYDGVNSIQESVVKLAGNLSRVVDVFTPGNVDWLDQHDDDFGSGGVLLLPDQPGAAPHLVFAAGKHGVLYALNRDRLGGYVAGGPDRALAELDIGPCWCASSYFTGSDGIGRVVTGGRGEIGIWAVGTAPFRVTLQSVTPAPLPGLQDPGVFSSVSSNGTQPGSAVIWSVSRPVDASPALVNLYAFNAATGALIFAAPAGTWPTSGSNANIVPVVANGHVYVASYKTLTIFGLGGESSRHLPPLAHPAENARPPGHSVSGTIVALEGTRVMVRTRTGRLVRLDAAPAIRAGSSANLALGRTVSARGAYVPGGTFEARAIERAKTSPAMWPPDR